MATLNPLGAAAGVLDKLLGGGLVQAQRLLRLHTPLGADALFAEDVALWEGIGPHHGPALGDDPEAGPTADLGPAGRSPFATCLGPIRAGLRLVVHALAPDAHLSLKTLIGQPALVELLCQESRTELRPWHGHIVAAALLGSDGGLARYRLVIEPWLAALGHRTDAWVFQDQSVPQIIDDLFAGWAGQGRLVPAWRWDLADAGVYPRRSLCIQYRESDLDFVQRLMREEGLFCWWEHTGDAASPALGAHTLVIADHNGAFAANVQPVVRFTASDHTLGADSLVRWQGVARVASARVAMRSRDHRALADRPVEALAGSAAQPASPLPELAVVDVPCAYAYEDLAQGQRLASRQAEALAAVRSRAVAAGPWRRAQVATRFTLADHPRHAGLDDTRDSFIVLAAEHRARNDLAADEAASLGGIGGIGGMSGSRLRGEGRAARPGRHEDEPLHQAALLVQPSAVAVRLGADDPAAWRLGADRHPGVLGDRGDRASPDAAAPGRALHRQPGTARAEHDDDDGDGNVHGDHGEATAPRATPSPPGEAPPSLFDPHAQARLGQPEVRLNPRPTVRGTQTALVVGDAGGDLHTDRDGRVRVQFHWQRGSASSHRLGSADGGDGGADKATSNATSSATDNAPASAASFAWVRVGASLAGANFGAVFTPRIGQEVLVAFTGGDIDRPVVIGTVYNAEGTPDAQGNRIAHGAAGASGNAPAWFPGEQAGKGASSAASATAATSATSAAAAIPAPSDTPSTALPEGHRHGAVLLGHKSQELGASRSGLGGSNQLVFDDSAGANRIELSTTTAQTRLQLGALLQQQGNQRLAARGHGLELASAAHGALRAGAGLLLSAHAQPASTGIGQQLEAREPRRVLEAAQVLVLALAVSAQASRAKIEGEPVLAAASPPDASTRPAPAAGAGHAPQPPQPPRLPVQQGMQALAESLAGTAASQGALDAGPGGAGASDVALPGAGPTAGALAEGPAGPIDTPPAKPIDGGHGTVSAWTRPELVLAAPNGIGLFTPAAAVLTAGSHVAMTAGHDLNTVAQANHATVARQGVVFYTYGRATDAAKPNQETGIALHAATGSVVASANTGAARLTASASVEVTSTRANVLVASPQQVLMTAAGAAIRIESGNITLSAPGKVAFKAGMKVLTGAGSVTVPGLQMASVTLTMPPQPLQVSLVDADGQAPGAEFVSVRDGRGVEHGLSVAGAPGTLSDFKPGLTTVRQPKRRD